MLGILDKHGFKYATPEGAYYVMADFRHLHGGDDDGLRVLVDRRTRCCNRAGSSFYTSDPRLSRGLVRFAFPKKDETFDLVEKRFEKLKTLR